MGQRSDISSIESEAEDGKIITKVDKAKNLNTLLMKNLEEDLDYDEAIRQSNIMINKTGRTRNMGSDRGEDSDIRVNAFDSDDGEEEKQTLTPHRAKLDVLKKHSNRKKNMTSSQGSRKQSDDSGSPEPRFKSSLMNNVDTYSPEKKRHRDTAAVDLDLDLDSENSEEEIRPRRNEKQ